MISYLIFEMLHTLSLPSALVLSPAPSWEMALITKTPVISNTCRNSGHVRRMGGASPPGPGWSVTGCVVSHTPHLWYHSGPPQPSWSRGDVTKEVKAEVGARQLILRIMRGQFSSKMTMFLMCRHTPIPQPGICLIEIFTCVHKGVCKRVFNGTLWEENGQ